MPNYDVICPIHGRYERFRPIDDRHSPCGMSSGDGMCGAPVEIVLSSSVSHRPFRPYFDISLGAEITSNHQRNEIARRLDAQPRDQPSRGDQSAWRDRSNEMERGRS